MSYRRDRFTWTAFGALFAFGYLNAVLGPSLPYIRSVEDIPYLVGALHQVALAVGAGVAGALSARNRIHLGRRPVIAGGIAGRALAGLAIGYGEVAPITIAGALVMGLLATLALIRVWAALADAHGPRPRGRDDRGRGGGQPGRHRDAPAHRRAGRRRGQLAAGVRDWDR